MDAAWLIFDSVSFGATPFAENGPDTMPNLKQLAESQGTIFTNCYAPGHSSPSSHASFFTGKYPSDIGMHAANPQFDGQYPTIADVTGQSHRSLLTTINIFLNTGLESGFDKSVDLYRDAHMIFPEASNPVHEFKGDLPLEMYLRFVFEDGKPIRSIINGIKHQLDSPSMSDPLIDRINEEIRDFNQANEGHPKLYVANYMTAHAPFDPSDAAIEKFSEDFDRNELPIGVSGRETHDRYRSDPEYNAEDMYQLYLASIWDLDKEVTPLIRELLDQDTIVFVMSDHGNWFRRDSELDEKRIHVPLIAFTPDSDGDYVDHTANLRHLGATTTSLLQEEHPEVKQLPGENLLALSNDTISITEFIHQETEYGQPVSPKGIAGTDDEIVYRAAGVFDTARINYHGGKGDYEVVRGDQDDIDTLQSELERHVNKSVNMGSEEAIEYDDEAKNRLRKLGYLG